MPRPNKQTVEAMIRGAVLPSKDSDYAVSRDFTPGPMARQAADLHTQVKEAFGDVSEFYRNFYGSGFGPDQDPRTLLREHTRATRFYHDALRTADGSGPLKDLFTRLRTAHKNAAWETARSMGPDREIEDLLAENPAEPQRNPDYTAAGPKAVRASAKVLKLMKGVPDMEQAAAHIRPRLRSVLQQHGQRNLSEPTTGTEMAAYNKAVEDYRLGLTSVVPHHPAESRTDLVNLHKGLWNAHHTYYHKASDAGHHALALAHLDASNAHAEAMQAAVNAAHDQTQLGRDDGPSRIPVSDPTPEDRKARGGDRLVYDHYAPTPDPRVNWVTDDVFKHPDLNIARWQQGTFEVVPLHTLRPWHGVNRQYVENSVVPRLKRGDPTHVFHIAENGKIGDGHHRAAGLLDLYRDPDMMVPVVRVKNVADPIAATTAPDAVYEAQRRAEKQAWYVERGLPVPEHLARLKAPAGGGIVNSTYTKGGRFMAGVLKRLRDVRRDGRPIQFARDGYEYTWHPVTEANRATAAAIKSPPAEDTPSHDGLHAMFGSTPTSFEFKKSLLFGHRLSRNEYFEDAEAHHTEMASKHRKSAMRAGDMVFHVKNRTDTHNTESDLRAWSDLRDKHRRAGELHERAANYLRSRYAVRLARADLSMSALLPVVRRSFPTAEVNPDDPTQITADHPSGRTLSLQHHAPMNFVGIAFDHTDRPSWQRMWTDAQVNPGSLAFARDLKALAHGLSAAKYEVGHTGGTDQRRGKLYHNFLTGIGFKYKGKHTVGGWPYHAYTTDKTVPAQPYADDEGTPARLARADSYQYMPAGEDEVRPAQGSLTDHQIRKVESRLGLPENSYKRKVLPDGRVSADVEDVSDFLSKATRARGAGDKDATKVLNDPEVSGDEKVAHLWTHIHDEADRFLREFGEQAGGKHWYGSSIDALEKSVHQLVSRERPFDPTSKHVPDHPLWGSEGKPGPGMQLFKAYMALTSGNNKPVANTLAALRILKTGTDKAGPGGDPFMHMSGYNTEALDNARRHLTALFPGNARAQRPGVGIRERLQWVAKYGKTAEKAAKSRSADYGFAEQPILVHNQTAQPMAIVKGKDKYVWLRSYKGPQDKTLGTPVNIPITDANGDLRPKGWSSRARDVADKVEGFKRLLTAAKGSHGTVVKWLNENYTDPKKFKALVRTFQGKSDADAVNVSRGDLEKGEAVPGSFLLGPKFGAFYQNLSKNPQHVTMDKWWSRTVYRLLGSLTTGSPDAPRSTSDRRVMRRAAHEAAKALRLSPAELQAVLWYHEQNLWRLFGAKNQSEDFKQGGEHALERFGFPAAAAADPAGGQAGGRGANAGGGQTRPRPAARGAGGKGR